ncbi:thermonuclease family protein [Enhygromyxa salina]|uniref:thermonuclease family protein n=1 Tax=Enhygromyxa salina TaxID=215803 RepID=UPI002158B769|nr:thermonuclease family protein [Enhygromyxa salina]
MSLLLASVALSSVGCLGFGGPLLPETDGGDDEASESDSGTGSETTEHPCGPTSGVVERVIDGDTMVLESGDRVRYILVNTPEITDGKNECWGSQASDYNSMQVLGRTVTIEYDQECRDQYGRLLGYVSVEDLEINRALLENGFACILHISPNGDSRLAEYQALENEAKTAEIGMWGACATVSCD